MCLVSLVVLNSKKTELGAIISSSRLRTLGYCKLLWLGYYDMRLHRFCHSVHEEVNFLLNSFTHLHGLTINEIEANHSQVTSPL